MGIGLVDKKTKDFFTPNNQCMDMVWHRTCVNM